MGIRYIKCSFNKDASPAAPDIRERLYTYQTSDDAITVGDLAEVIDGKGAGKRVRVMEVGLLKPTFACNNVKLWVEPAASAPPKSTPNMAGDDYAAAKLSSAAAARRVMRSDPFLDESTAMDERNHDGDDSLDFE